MKQATFILVLTCVFYVNASAQESVLRKSTKSVNEGGSGKTDRDTLDSGKIVGASDTTDIVGHYFDSLFQILPEVMVTGERPLVKATQGKLIYDLPALISNKPVDNTYDALKELPGVTESNERLTLAGQSVTVILDGKTSTLTIEQLNALLKSIPASRIAKAEVMFSAPARYQVRGAVINILLKKGDADTPSLQGELYGDYRQKYYEGVRNRVSLLYSANKFSTDFLYSYNYGRSPFFTEKEAIHTLSDGTVHPMNTEEESRTRKNSHSVRIGADYNFSKDHQLSLVYNSDFSNWHNIARVDGSQTSNTRTRSTATLHNVRLDYHIPIGMKVGVETTYYNSPSSQLLQSVLNDEQMDFFSKDAQRINRWKVFLSEEYAVGKGWGVNYGGVYTTSIDHSYQYYYDTETGKLLSNQDNMKSRRREQTWNFYTGVNKSFGDKLSLDASIAVEQFHTAIWNDWNVFPTLNFNYMSSSNSVWQLSFTSDKTYPEYWATQDAVSYMGGEYSEVQGNPYLKPSIDYQLQLTYILKSKYMFSLWYSYEKDDFKQSLYQSPERLVEIYKCFNSDFDRQMGLQTVVPFIVKGALNSKITLIGVYDRQKNSQFWNIPYDRHVYYGMAVMSNTLTLSNDPDIKFTLNGMIRSKAIQGIYDLPSSGNLDAGLRYTFSKGKAILTLRCNDLFETSQISPLIHFAMQRVTNNYSSFREFGLSFTYKFGGYKEKQRKEVDTSRFK